MQNGIAILWHADGTINIANWAFIDLVYILRKEDVRVNLLDKGQYKLIYRIEMIFVYRMIK